MFKYNRKTGEILEYSINESWYDRIGYTDGFNSREELNNWINQLTEQPKLNNCAGGLHPSNKTWDNYLKNHCTFNFEYFGYKVYNATNCWYLVDSQNNVIDNIYGYNVWRVLQGLTGQPIGDIRDKFDTKEEFSKATGLIY